MSNSIDQQLEEMAKQEIEKEMNQEEWPDPIPIRYFDNLPDFPSSIIPSPGREMIETVAYVNQVDEGMPGSIFLAVLSTCLAKKSIVNLVTHEEPLNLYICAIAPPGERKSRTIGLMTSPIFRYQKDKADEMQDIITEAYNKRKIEEQRLAMLQKKAAKSNRDNLKKLQEEATKLSIHINDNPLPQASDYIVDDVSTEAIGNIMSDNGERLSMISAEGGIFGIMAGRYNKQGGAHYDIYLKSHAGDPWSTHRIGREQKTMLKPALTMCLTVQPDVIQEIGNNSHFRGRGLLARFLYNVCKAKAGDRMRNQKMMPESLLVKYNEFINNLMDIPLEQSTLKCSIEAQNIWNEFYNDIESEMKSGRSLDALKDWGSKLPGAVARIAGLLHFAEYGSHASVKPISAGIASASCAIGAYFKEHALAVFGLMKEDPRIEAAKKIIQYLETHKPNTFKGRDILTYKSAFKAMDDVNPGLKILIERDYIRELSKEYLGKGRPPAPEYAVNPKVYLL